MTKPTWADFVRWVAMYRIDGIKRRRAIYGSASVFTLEGARCVLGAVYGDDNETFRKKVEEFTAEHGAPVDPPAAIDTGPCAVWSFHGEPHVIVRTSAAFGTVFAEFGGIRSAIDVMELTPENGWAYVGRVADLHAADSGPSEGATKLLAMAEQAAADRAVVGLREKLVALADELEKEADESKRVNRFDDDYSAAVAAAIALRSAESRLRAIIGVTEDAHG